MKKFIAKNKGLIIAIGMVVGVVVGFIGLDFEQSQIKSRANASTGMMVTGAVLFFGSIGWLCTSSSGWGRRSNK